MKNFFKFLFFLMIGFFLLAEVILRLLGIADVPIRSANNVTGYIPLPSQSGRFLNNRWKINELSMISEKSFNTYGYTVLVAGDSVVFGGNQLDQRERVGEKLGKLLGSKNIYSVADGGWSFKNQINYIRQNQKMLVGVKQIIFVLNSGDFEEPSSWRCESFHPTSRPYSSLYFSLRKYFFPVCEKQVKEKLIVKDFDLSSNLGYLAKEFNSVQFSILLYPDKAEFVNSQSLRPLIEKLDLQEFAVYEINEFTGIWSEKFYSDGIHPSVEGAGALAAILKIIVDRQVR